MNSRTSCSWAMLSARSIKFVHCRVHSKRNIAYIRVVLYYLVEPNACNITMKSLRTRRRFLNTITIVCDEYAFNVCSYERAAWSRIATSSVSSSLSLLRDKCSLKTRERICSRTWCKDSDLWSILSFRGVASPLAVPPAGVCGVLLGGIGVFVPSPVPVITKLFIFDKKMCSHDLYIYSQRILILIMTCFNNDNRLILSFILSFRTHTIARGTSWTFRASYFSYNFLILHVKP